LNIKLGFPAFATMILRKRSAFLFVSANTGHF
jgi:hypothetical protein